MTTTIVTAKGTKLCIVEKDNGIELKSLTEEYFDAYAGILKTKGKLTRSLIAQRAKDWK